MDPILKSIMICPSKFKYSGFVKRANLLEKCNDKFAQDLDVLTLLSKIKDTYGMLEHFKSKEHREFLKYNKDRTIIMSESDVSGDASNDDCLCFEDHQSQMLSMRESFRKTIVKGMNINKKIK